MAIYVIMEPARQSAERNAQDTVFIRDGFAFLAFLVPFVWLLWYRLWIEAALALGVALLLAALGEYGGLGPIAPLLSFLVSIYVGLEGTALRINALRRRGWREAGVVEADSAEDAETRHFAEQGIEQPQASELPAAALPASALPALRPAHPSPAIGLFPYPGGR